MHAAGESITATVRLTGSQNEHGLDRLGVLWMLTAAPSSHVQPMAMLGPKMPWPPLMLHTANGPQVSRHTEAADS